MWIIKLQYEYLQLVQKKNKNDSRQLKSPAEGEENPCTV